MALSYTAAGWPYMTGTSYIYEAAKYSEEIAAKLERGESSAAVAIAAADRAERAAAALTRSTVTVPLSSGWGGTLILDRVGPIITVAGTITVPAGGLLRIATLPAGSRPARFLSLGTLTTSAGGHIVPVIDTAGNVDIWTFIGAAPAGTSVIMTGTYMAAA